MERERLLTIQEASEILRVSVPTLRSWRFKKRISFVKVGNLLRFRLSDLQRIMEKGLPLDE